MLYFYFCLPIAARILLSLLQETVVDRNGVTTIHAYDTDGNVTRSEVFDTDNSLIQTTDYEYDVILPWGTPIDPSSGIMPYTGDPGTRPSSDEQAQMVGIGHDGMFFYPSNLPRVLKTEMRRGRTLPPQARARQQRLGPPPPARPFASG